jgi:hypothetical protein
MSKLRGRTYLGVMVCAGAAAWLGVVPALAAATTTTFTGNGSSSAFVVPPNVRSLSLVAIGGAGGMGGAPSALPAVAPAVTGRRCPGRTSRSSRA